MIPTLKIIVLVVAGLWGSAFLVLLVALCRAASRPAPEMNAAEQWQPRLKRMRKNRRQADELHSLPT